jgi:hypothetical protein
MGSLLGNEKLLKIKSRRDDIMVENFAEAQEAGSWRQLYKPQNWHNKEPVKFMIQKLTNIQPINHSSHFTG